MVTPEVTSVLNATTAGNATPLLPTGAGGGVLEVISPLSLDGTAIPRGRMYAQAWVVDSMGNRLFTVWSGYLQTAGSTPAGPASVPGIPLDPAWSIIAVVTQTGQGAAARVGFAALISPGGVARGSPGYIHAEAPGAGRGERVLTAISSPAAGASPGTQTVGAKERLRLLAMRALLQTSAVAADRKPRLSLVASGGSVMSRAYALPVVPASSTCQVDWRLRGARQGSSQLVAEGDITDIPLVEGDTVTWDTTGIDAGDQYSAVVMTVEQWAVP